MHRFLVGLLAVALVPSACREPVETTAPTASAPGAAQTGAPASATLAGAEAAAPSDDGVDATQPGKPADAPSPDAPAAGSGRKVLVLHLGCRSVEAVSDLEYAASGLRDYLKEHEIVLAVAEKSKSCGCGLVWGQKKKYLQGAMTDVDLMYAVNDFFGLPNTDLE